MVDSEKRLKSMQWLKKWDVFRQTKNEYVHKAIELLKGKRRIKNLVILMALKHLISYVGVTYRARYRFYRRKQAAIYIAIKLYGRYNHHYRKFYGLDFDFRQTNAARRSATLVGIVASETLCGRAAGVVKEVLKKA